MRNTRKSNKKKKGKAFCLGHHHLRSHSELNALQIRLKSSGSVICQNHHTGRRLSEQIEEIV